MSNPNLTRRSTPSRRIGGCGRVNGRGGSRARRSRGQLDGRGDGQQQSQHEQGGGRGGPHPVRGKKYNTPLPDNIATMTVDDIVFFGLCLVGFGRERQNVRKQLLHDRFLAFYGPDPRSVKDLLFDMKENFEDTSFVDVMMTLNWAKRYDVEHVLAGRWGYGEEYIGAKIKETAKRIQSFFPKMIVFDPEIFDEREIHIISVDTFNCTTEEMRQTPSTAFYDHKANACGLKYQAALPIRHVSLFEFESLLIVLLLSYHYFTAFPCLARRPYEGRRKAR